MYLRISPGEFFTAQGVLILEGREAKLRRMRGAFQATQQEYGVSGLFLYTVYRSRGLPRSSHYLFVNLPKRAWRVERFGW